MTKKKFVFSFTTAGLFSEINNFLVTILYAHKNNFEIVIDYSSLGCIDWMTLNTILDLKAFNRECPSIISKASSRSMRTYLYSYPGYLKFVWLFKYFFHNIHYQLYSLLNQTNIDLFQKHWSEIKNLRLGLSEEDKNFLFNSANTLWIHKCTEDFDSNSKFIGVHIRRGDKIKESAFISVDTYFDEIIKQCRIIDTKDVFLFIDHLDVGLKLKKMLNKYNVTLSYLDEKGYFHEKFLTFPVEIKINKTLLLCDIVNKMSYASHFIGSNDGNLSAFIYLLREGKNTTDLRNGSVFTY